MGRLFSSFRLSFIILLMVGLCSSCSAPSSKSKRPAVWDKMKAAQEAEDAKEAQKKAEEAQTKKKK
ncbi:MAG: hypothetical protein A2X86_18770 [Bdellovibrionales bacterium GWA2_49_15]|nr:MAG: hypothetical protein A2X86_18770 [Bdellovibrionales bacterium GWA2_49_15]HAZ14270.1 hypothetical protein [Bdellovibrionales bacterium]